MTVRSSQARLFRPPQRRRDLRRRGAAPPLAVAVLCLIALAFVWMIANLWPAAHREDAVLLNWCTELERPRLDRGAKFITALLEPLPFVLWGAGLLGIAIVRRRPRIALAIVAIMSLAPLTTEALKPLVAHPHAEIGRGAHVPAASWPSGHATAALALVLCAVLVSPRRVRPFVAATGGPFAAAIGGSQLLLGRHMPSDVLGGYLVAMLWTAIAIAGLRGRA